MDNVISRLGAAKEGNADLDEAVALAIGWTIRGTIPPCPHDMWHEPGMALCVEHDGPPSFTTSLDAAITLVPKGARIRELGQWWDIDRPGGWFCNIMRWERDEQLHLIERAYTFGFAESDTQMPQTAPTAALAVCIAALKMHTTAPNRF